VNSLHLPQWLVSEHMRRGGGKVIMEPFKNLISEEVVTLIGLHLGKALPDLDKDAFVASILPHLRQLEMKQRVQFISDKMLTVLPSTLTSLIMR
jgi:hypothetical protein